MRTIAVVIILSACFFSISAHAQWSLIASLNEWSPIYQDSVADVPSCAYFIDLQGPARIGFAGTDAGIWKTSDGGNSWRKIPVHGYGVVENICFKDSLMGWFVATGGGGSTGSPAGSTLYSTTDGGNTWNWDSIAGAMDGAESISYVPSINRLFLALDSSILVSSDLGDTWQTVISMDSGSIIGGFSFASDSIGYAAVIGPPDYAHPYIPIRMRMLRTFNGGLTWLSAELPAYTYTLRPLAIPGTSICFSGTASDISRSDDYGKTWRAIAYPDSSDWEPENPIQGNLSRLFAQGSTGMFVSTDGGYTWNNDGPQYDYSGINQEFYVGKGIVVAGMALKDNDYWVGGGLWEEAIPQADVAPSDSVPATEVTVFPNPTTGFVTIRGVAGVVEVTNMLGERVAGTGTGGTGAKGTTPQPPPTPLRSAGGGVALDLSKLPPGTYFALIETANGIVVRKILKE